MGIQCKNRTFLLRGMLRGGWRRVDEWGLLSLCRLEVVDERLRRRLRRFNPRLLLVHPRFKVEGQPSLFLFLQEGRFLCSSVVNDGSWWWGRWLVQRR